MPLDAYQVLLEEHIIRKNAGLPTEHPNDYADRMEQERLANLHSNAERNEHQENDADESEE